MKRLFLVFTLIPVVLWAQNPFPGNSRKLWLGYQTSAEGLIHYGSGAPTYTPGFLTGPSHYQDTTNNVLYQWDRIALEWDVLSGFNGIFSIENDGAMLPTDMDVLFNGNHIKFSQFGTNTQFTFDPALPRLRAEIDDGSSESYFNLEDNAFEVFIDPLGLGTSFGYFIVDPSVSNNPSVYFESFSNPGVNSGSAIELDTTGIDFSGYGNGIFYRFTFPKSAPSAGDILQDSDGNGILEWVAATSITGTTATGTGIPGTLPSSVFDDNLLVTATIICASGASENTVLTIPTPSSDLAGRQIMMVAYDSSGSFSCQYTAGTNNIVVSGSSSTTTTVTMSDGQNDIMTCGIGPDGSTYKWLSKQ